MCNLPCNHTIRALVFNVYMAVWKLRRESFIAWRDQSSPFGLWACSRGSAFAWRDKTFLAWVSIMGEDRMRESMTYSGIWVNGECQRKCIYFSISLLYFLTRSIYCLCSWSVSNLAGIIQIPVSFTHCMLGKLNPLTLNGGSTLERF